LQKNINLIAINYIVPLIHLFAAGNPYGFTFK